MGIPIPLHIPLLDHSVSRPEREKGVLPVRHRSFTSPNNFCQNLSNNISDRPILPPVPTLFWTKEYVLFFLIPVTLVIFSSRQASLISSVSSLAGVTLRSVYHAYAAGQHHVPPRRKPAPGPGKSLLQRVSSQRVFLDVFIHLFSYLDLFNCVVSGNTQINN